jgi:mannosyltransferase
MTVPNTHLRTPSHPWRQWMEPSRILLLILSLAAALRLWGIGTESLWLDEAITADRAGLSMTELVRNFRAESQTTVYDLGEKLWCTALGHSEAALRLPSAILGVLAVWSIFLLARLLFTAKAALWASFLLAINPFAIYYSQEARYYILLLTASVFSQFFLLNFLRSRGRTGGWGYMISAAMGLYSHPLGPLLLIVHVTMVYMFCDKTAGQAKSMRFWKAWRLIAAVFVVYLPQLIFLRGAILSKIKGTSHASWIPLPQTFDFVETIRQYFMSPYLAGFAILLLAIAMIALPRADRTERQGIYLCGIVFLVFVPLLWVASFILTPLYVIRCTIPAVAALLLILGWRLAAMKRPLRIIALGIYLLLTAQALHAYYRMSNKDPWRRTAQIVKELVRPGDVLVLDAPYIRPALQYYYSVPSDVALIAPYSMKGISAALDTSRRIVVVRAYPFKQSTITDSLYARAARGRRASPAVRVNDFAPQNPWAYWIADIGVTRYERPD